MAALVAQVQQLKFGDLETSFMGPLISHGHRDKVESYVALAKAEGTFLMFCSSDPSNVFLVDTAVGSPVGHFHRVCRPVSFTLVVLQRP